MPGSHSESMYFLSLHLVHSTPATSTLGFAISSARCMLSPDMAMKQSERSEEVTSLTGVGSRDSGRKRSEVSSNSFEKFSCKEMKKNSCK